MIPIYVPSLTEKETLYMNQAIASGWVSSLGEFINRFEESFASFCGTKYAVSTSNGTTALHLALKVAGIMEGDEVIIPDLTFVATSNAVKYLKASPVYVDIEDFNLCIDPQKIIEAITPKTKCILPVHLYGHPANMQEIMQIANKYGLIVIEDAAEAHGAEVNGKRVGSFGNMGVFSFYGNKIITTGEGGMITTNDSNYYEKLKFYRDHAMSKDKRYWHTDIGFNYRMTNVQAALGLAQLERINDILALKNNIYNWYFSFLGDIEGISLNRTSSWAKNVYWLISLQIYGISLEKREEFINILKGKGIDCRPFFYPLSQMPMNINDIKMDTFTVDKNYKIGINLPSYCDLTYEQVEFICNEIISIVQDK